jgi:CubicO group peptidase (beta-lactamase class C family)
MLWRGVLLLWAGAIAFAQSDDEIRRILANRIDRDKKSPGIVVGMIDPNGGRRVVAHGKVQGDTLFEIGSITKVFTALVLADMAERGEADLRDPVAKYLPEGVRMPRRGRREITLEDLATHMSGLPRLPTNLPLTNLANPYADYTPERLYQFLRSYELPRDPGSKWEYSNLGTGLLGHVLSRRAGTDYETLVRLRICGPLDMFSTWMIVPQHLRVLMASGHSMQQLPVGNWTFDALAGAGAFWSDMADLLEFVAGNLGHKASGLAPAMAAMLKVRPDIGQGKMGQALGWNTMIRLEGDLFWKDGGTLGFSTFIGFDPKRRAGVVVLSNAAGGVNDIGVHLLDNRSPLRTFETGPGK